MEWMITADEPGKTYLLQGNEAMARGAIEAGLQFAAAYPGSPSSEILTMLGHVAKDMGFYAEWSTNETCSFEACMGASMAGVRSLCIAKQNGLLVMGDALHTAALYGCKGGVVLIVADDPSAHSSTNEFDARHQARSASLPLLEPATFQEAKDMIKYAFDLSEELQQVVMVRGVTRIHHGRGNVTLGELPVSKSPLNEKPSQIENWDKLFAINFFHDAMYDKLNRAQASFEQSPFNWYRGPKDADCVMVVCGMGWLYGEEAIDTLKLNDQVGILKLGCTWPLPEQFIVRHLGGAKKVLIAEEVDPFLEQNLANIIAHHPELNVEMYGRYQARAFPHSKELTPDLVLSALADIMKIEQRPKPCIDIEPERQVTIPPRELTFCAGCPHRASYYIFKQALGLQAHGGLIMGDIGCYTLGALRAGHYGVNSMGCMGEGVNMGEGLGQLTRFGFDKPVMALAGDSTFFHSCIPGLINAKYHNSNMLFIVLDNAATAMTGFQPHPGIGLTAMGDPAQPISIEKVVEALGCPVTVADPYEIEKSIAVIYKLLKEPGLKVLILKRDCATLTMRKGPKRRVWVDTDLCRGDDCGCGRYCSTTWGCPGNIWNSTKKKAEIDEVVCIGCGVCTTLCPAGAIKMEGGEE
ncbi:MAG: thiamine pyrophosphate-dependent enzyme [Syntrophomonadaceae bacterium]